MGMYDTILVPCPECGTKYECQSKSGECRLGVYEMDEAPGDVMYDVNRHAPYTCPNCGVQFGVKFEIIPAKVKKATPMEWAELVKENDDD